MPSRRREARRTTCNAPRVATGALARHTPRPRPGYARTLRRARKRSGPRTRVGCMRRPPDIPYTVQPSAYSGMPRVTWVHSGLYLNLGKGQRPDRLTASPAGRAGRPTGRRPGRPGRPRARWRAPRTPRRRCSRTARPPWHGGRRTIRTRQQRSSCFPCPYTMRLRPYSGNPGRLSRIAGYPWVALTAKGGGGRSPRPPSQLAHAERARQAAPPKGRLLSAEVRHTRPPGLRAARPRAS